MRLESELWLLNESKAREELEAIESHLADLSPEHKPKQQIQRIAELRKVVSAAPRLRDAITELLEEQRAIVDAHNSLVARMYSWQEISLDN